MSLRDHLQVIYDEHGQLTPELVVQIARPKTHPLHAYVFNLAPKDAAQAWYHHRAHELIQRVKVAYKTDPDGTDHHVRRWHCVQTPTGRVYEPNDKVATDPFLREMRLRDMEREWRALLGKYEGFREFVAMVTADMQQAA